MAAESISGVDVSVTLSPVLTFVAYSQDTSAKELIHKFCREFYSIEELQQAKEILWKVGDNGILPFT